MISLTTEELIKKISELKVGDKILLSGIIYTARDAAHKRLIELIENNKPLPIELKNSIIYYCGPAPAKPGFVIGPCGPTTSNRMDVFTPQLLAKGVKATIGKGKRSKEVNQAFAKYQAVYLVATGGVAALFTKKIKKSEIIAFENLGTEAIRKLEVKDLPLFVATDSKGNDIFNR